MKVLHISTEDFNGGAARAAFRLHKELNRHRTLSQMLVRNSQISSDSIIQETSFVTKLSPIINRWSLHQYPKRNSSLFSSQWFIDSLAKRISEINPDIVNLHWVCDGFMRPETLKKIHKPIVWTLHDMWPFTGGCHYSQDCSRYIHQCGNCPILHSYKEKDLSFHIFQRKLKAWKDINLTVVTPSKWLAHCAQESALFKHRKIEVIANGIDTNIFRPGFREAAREILRMPKDVNLILFASGSTTGDPRKGFKYLSKALEFLQQQKDSNFELAILGEDAPSVLPTWPFKTHYLGKFNDEVSLALVYNAADIFIAPSIQDNLPNTVIEALSCGTPCIAFNIGGMPDMIVHQANGFLAIPLKADSLADNISKVMNDSNMLHNLSLNARSTALSKFSVETQSEKYLELYRNILTPHE